MSIEVTTIDTLYAAPASGNRHRLWDLVQLSEDRFAVAYKDVCNLMVFTVGADASVEGIEDIDICARGSTRGRQGISAFPWSGDSLGVFDRISEEFRIYSRHGEYGRRVPISLPQGGSVGSARLLSDTTGIIAFYPRPGLEVPDGMKHSGAGRLLQLVHLGTGSTLWGRLDLPAVARRRDFPIATGLVFCVESTRAPTPRFAVMNRLMFEVYVGRLWGDEFGRLVRRTDLPELGRGEDNGTIAPRTRAASLACGNEGVTALHSVSTDGSQSDSDVARGFVQVLTYEGQLLQELVLTVGAPAYDLRRAVHIGDGMFIGIVDDDRGSALVRIKTTERGVS